MSEEVSFNSQLACGMALITSANDRVQASIAELNEKTKKWDAYQVQMHEASDMAKRKITFNVGGQVFATSKTTLLSFENSYFWAMLNSGKWQPDEDGSYFIDRNPRLFEYVIEFMRSSDSSFLETLSKRDRNLLEVEFDYYQIAFPAYSASISWNTEIDPNHITYSSDGMCATKKFVQGWNASSLSAQPVESYKIRINNRGAGGYVMLGLMDPTKFLSYASTYTASSSYCVYVSNGNAYSNSGGSIVPCTGLIATGSVVEFVRDRGSQSISIGIDGAKAMVAFRDVPDVALHAFCNFFDSEASVQIVL